MFTFTCIGQAENWKIFGGIEHFSRANHFEKFDGIVIKDPLKAVEGFELISDNLDIYLGVNKESSITDFITLGTSLSLHRRQEVVRCFCHNCNKFSVEIRDDLISAVLRQDIDLHILDRSFVRFILSQGFAWRATFSESMDSSFEMIPSLKSDFRLSQKLGLMVQYGYRKSFGVSKIWGEHYGVNLYVKLN